MEGLNLKVEGIDKIKEQFNNLLETIEDKENKTFDEIMNEISKKWHELSEEERKLISVKLINRE